MRVRLLAVAALLVATAFTVVATPSASATPVCFSVNGATYCCPEPPMCGLRQMCPMYLWEPCYIQAVEHVVGTTILP